MPKALEIEGQIFNGVTVLSRAGTRNGRSLWRCKCKCGAIFNAVGKHLKNGSCRSCGCIKIEASKKNLPDNRKPIGYKRKVSKGYIEIKTESGFVREHVYVMEKHLGRKLESDEIVHHRDGNKENNNILNLEVMRHGQHTTIHNRGRKYRYESRLKMGESKVILSDDQVKKVLNMRDSGISQNRIAHTLGVSQMTISRLVRNKTIGYSNVISRYK